VADTTGFLKFDRELPPRRPVDIRILDWKDVYLSRKNGEDAVFPVGEVRKQAARCMDCGIPFCHHACPVANLIPEWNDLARRDDWHEAIERLHSTNNFPEFTGKLCPAPCEGSCVLNLQESPVTIKQIEWEIIDRAYDEGWVQPQIPGERTGRKVAVIGSGPAGLAAAQQLTRAGHDVTVYERADRVGGLLRYGIPEFKMEKALLDRRLDQMRAEGTRFVTGVEVGGSKDGDLSTEQLRAEYDAVVLAGGATIGRDLPVPGRELAGIHLAMEYLPYGNLQALGELDDPPINAHGKHVVIIGGGDTGADCLGTSHRQGAASVTQLEIMPAPPERRAHDSNPWPTYPMIMRVSSAHEEGGERLYSVNTERFLGDSADGRKVTCGRCSCTRWSGSTAGSRRSRAPSVSCPRTWSSSPWASPGPSAKGSSTSWASRSTVGATWLATRSSCPPSRACSSPATSAVVSRSSSGRSPRAVRPRRRPTPGSPATRCCRAR
jgi:glutamate synthase (NADPH/NADH) small chain